MAAVYVGRAGAYGVALSVLARRPRGLMLMAWRPDLVAAVLADAESRALLASAGVDASAPDAASRSSTGAEAVECAGFSPDQVAGYDALASCQADKDLLQPRAS